jgi:hypothetical protein
MHVLRSPAFLICLVLFALHQFLQKGLNIHFPFFSRYLDNMLAMPVILTLLLAERQWLFKKSVDYRIPGLDIIAATFYIAIVSEIVFPLLSEKFTADWRDVIFYSLGSLLFYLTINRRNRPLQ